MFGWLKELLDLKIEYKRNNLDLLKTKDEVAIEHNICNSCETLKMQLAIANQEKKDLLNRILTPAVQQEVKFIPDTKAVIPQRHLGFNARRKVLEAESRNHAMLLDQKRKEDEKFAQADPHLKVVTRVENGEADIISVEDLESELDLAGANREAQSGVK